MAKLYFRDGDTAVELPLGKDLAAGTGVTVSEDSDTGVTTVGVDTDTVLTTEAAADTYIPSARLASGDSIAKSVNGQSTGAAIRCSSDDSKLVFTASSDTWFSSGGYLALLGAEYSGTDRTPGSFALRANDGTNSAFLLGLPDGTLTWNGKNVLLEGDSTASGDGLASAITSVTVGDSTISASGETALTLAAGDGVTLSADEDTNTVTISETYVDVAAVSDLSAVPDNLRVGGLVVLTETA